MKKNNTQNTKLCYLMINMKDNPTIEQISCLSFGKRLLEITKASFNRYLVQTILLPPIGYLSSFQETFHETEFKIFSQRCDNKTGSGLCSSSTLRDMKIEGMILNHPENPQDISETLSLSNLNDLSSCVIVSSLDDLSWALQSSCRFLAYEPKEFIGQTESIIMKDLEQVKTFVERCSEKNKIPIIGGGVQSLYEFQTAVNLGVQGFLVSTFLIKNNPEKSYLTLMNDLCLV